MYVAHMYIYCVSSGPWKGFQFQQFRPFAVGESVPSTSWATSVGL